MKGGVRGRIGLLTAVREGDGRALGLCYVCHDCCRFHAPLDTLPSPASLTWGQVNSWLNGTLVSFSHLFIDVFHQLHEALQAF